MTVQLTVASTDASSCSTHVVTSKDGTVIGYRQYGSGPGLVLVQGTMGTAAHFTELAEALADSFTVYVPDRRGRGMSSATSAASSATGISEYSIQREVEDLDALLTGTGTSYVFGLSSGAIIALQAALTLPSISKVVIYEPPLFVGEVPVDLIRRYEQEMAEGRIAAALVTAMQAAQMGPPVFNYIPRGLLEFLLGMALRSEDKKGAGRYPTMRELAGTLHYDFQLVVGMKGKLPGFAAIPQEVLLLGGSQSPAYLKTALTALEQILPHARRVELNGVGHAAPWNKDQRGQPKPVADVIRQYFG